MSGATIKAVLEDVADNLLNPDPYYQQGGDMVRADGLTYTLRVDEAMGRRIADLRLARTGAPIDPAKTYTVAGWASINEGTQGPPVWDLVSRYIQDRKVIHMPEPRNVKVTGADPGGMS